MRFWPWAGGRVCRHPYSQAVPLTAQFSHKCMLLITRRLRLKVKRTLQSHRQGWKSAYGHPEHIANPLAVLQERCRITIKTSHIIPALTQILVCRWVLNRCSWSWGEWWGCPLLAVQKPPWEEPNATQLLILCLVSCLAVHAFQFGNKSLKMHGLS